ncbi:ATP-binding protein [Burkholderia multivorans]|uniref:ATP-binding protein n=1 Tax=Burkholderia multivorans TaxID=87883 RepID=UPI0009E0D0CA|nr:DUF499 domain-containing protein [Burkholderia multivorans]AYY98698.1 ATP-binding protein [Burkholderia multivorans]SAK14076.1 hypothetical protein UA17_00800 [Burkholderia multivorans]
MTDNLFTICEPRADVLKGALRESDFAADLAQVLKGDAPDEYKLPALFFANTYPTKGLKNVLKLVALRVLGRPEQVGAIFRLDTQFGGGKTHTLIALAHAMQGMQGVANADEFLEAALRPSSPVRIAAFDGENADPANGRRLEDDIRAHTPWGELAYALGGPEGYRLVEASDREGIAPGADTLRELIGSEPALILVDEIAPYLRKVSGRNVQRAAEQLAAFLTALMKAVESSPHAALIFTLAVGRDGKATDAYARETQEIAAFFAEAESVAARKATVIDPTEDDETVKVICRRLFAHIDRDKAEQVIAQYKALWDSNREQLPPAPAQDRRIDEFRAGYPLHPELVKVLTQKTGTLGNFQRVRGMLRLLARTVARLWELRPADAYAIQTQHIDLGFEPIRLELITRLKQDIYVPAIKGEIAAVDTTPALAEQLDAGPFKGLPTYGSYVARCAFMHTLAFNENLRGLNAEELRYAILGPGTDIAFIDDARKRFMTDSAYLDDRPGAPMRFLAEANLTQIIRREETNTDRDEVRTRLNSYIRDLFSGPNLNLIPFASGPHDVADDDGSGRPYLVMLGYDAVQVYSDAVRVDPLVERIYMHKGAGNDWRHNRNNLMFLVADAAGTPNMKAKMLRNIALETLRQTEKLKDLADYQVDKLRELHERSKQELAVAVQQCFRHIFYPSRNRLDGASCDLAHTVVDIQTASDRPGDGQRQVVTQLQNASKLRLPADQPDSPVYVRDRTPLKKGQITTAALRTEFRQDPSLPMLVGDDVFIKGIRLGIDQDVFVYQSGELLRGKGDPHAEIKVDEQSFLYTTTYARDHNIWPRPEPTSPTERGSESESESGSGGAGAGSSAGGHGSTGDGTPPPTVRSPNTVEAEDVLKAALTQVFEKAQHNKIQAFATMTIRPFDKGDALKLMPLVKSVPNAQKRVELEASFETSTGSTAEVEFGGDIDDAIVLKDYLEPQFRAASESDAVVNFILRFEPPLQVQGAPADGLIQRLTRLVSTAAHVIATGTDA